MEENANENDRQLFEASVGQNSQNGARVHPAVDRVHASLAHAGYLGDFK